ncbi:MAG: hypothetical protein VX278_21600 [Myxococcota bacterium]|nr:hypothetical protein [Myxococcota bacterium]
MFPHPYIFKIPKRKIYAGIVFSLLFLPACNSNKGTPPTTDQTVTALPQVQEAKPAEVTETKKNERTPANSDFFVSLLTKLNAEQGYAETLQESTTEENRIENEESAFYHLETIVGYLPLRTLKEAIPMPIFSSGPHQDEYIFDDKKQFGHYNPEFLTWFSANVLPKLREDAVRSATQSSYDKHFRQLALVALQSHRAIRSSKREDHQNGIKRYQEALAGNKAESIASNHKNPAEAFYYGYKGPPWHEVEEQYLEGPPEELEAIRRSYESPCEGRCAEDTMAFFWARRDIDGTSDQWIAILRGFIGIYDPDALKK